MILRHVRNIPCRNFTSDCVVIASDLVWTMLHFRVRDNLTFTLDAFFGSINTEWPKRSDTTAVEGKLGCFSFDS